MYRYGAPAEDVARGRRCRGSETIPGYTWGAIRAAPRSCACQLPADRDARARRRAEHEEGERDQDHT